MSRLVAITLFTLAAGCAKEARPTRITFECAPANEEVVRHIVHNWRNEFSQADSSGAAWRSTYGIVGTGAAEWTRQVSVVDDPNTCLRAGLAYAGETRLRTGVHRVAVVRAGKRHIAVDLSAIERAGEWMFVAVLDEHLRPLSRLGI